MPVPTDPETSAPPATAPTNDERDSSPVPVAEENGRASNGATSPLMQENGLVTGEDSGKPHKMFVGGLSWQTSEENLREYFEAFGEVTECNIMKDPLSKRSRGFGFITFREAESVEKVLETHAEEPICIDQKMIDPKIAIPPKKLSNKVKRIFVGGLSSDSTEEDLREYFEQFGKVVESQLMYDRNTNRHRGFGFVSFESEEPAEKVCSIQYHDIKGKKVEVKVAQTKEALAMQGRNRMFARNYATYGFPAATYTPYYPPQYSLDMLVGGMGGYSAAPVLIGGGGGDRSQRGTKGRNYSQYPGPGGFTYAPGYMEQPRMSNMAGYYGGPGYGSMPPMHLMRGTMIPTSGMDYLPEQFQGMAISPGYPATYSNAPPSPGSQYTPISPRMNGMDPTSISTGYTATSHMAYSPTHLSPKGTSSMNGFSTQVPTYTGSHNSYTVAQTSY